MDKATEMVTIENWAVVENVFPVAYQELLPGKRLTGYVFGHANLPNATFIYTSRIIRVDRNENLVETSNTVYKLGEMSREYESWNSRRKSEVAA